MSTWQLYSDAENNFRWQCTHIRLTREQLKVPIDKPSSPPHLPSIADLLVQGYSKLDDIQTGGIRRPPTFQTGLGKPVVVKQSSLVKASSILGDQDDAATVVSKTRYPKPYDNQSHEVESAPAFTTGSGKPVVVKQSSLLKASSILGDQDDSRTGYSKLYEIEKSPTFCTGLGKPVILKQASIAKASSILGDQEYKGCLKVIEDKNDQAKTPLMFQTGSGNLSVTRKSSLEKASSIFGDQYDDAFSGRSVGRDDETSCLSSMFQTGSGKTVNICSTGLIKARTLLGLEENAGHDEASKGLEQSRKHANAGEIKEVARGSVSCASRPPPIKFHTAGGRSVKVSSDALKRARHLLGDPDLGNSLKEGDARYPVCSSSKNGGSRDHMLDKENNACTFFSDDIPKAKQMSKNFISPVRSALSDQKNATRLENIGLRGNLINEFDAVEHDITIKQYEDIPCSLAPSTEDTSHAVEGVTGALVNNGCTLGISSVRKAMNGPLVDISNTTCLNSTDHKKVTGEKRKLSSRTYPSPFKKPRNSKFIPPLNKKPAVAPKGSTLAITSDGSCCKRSVSTRYPFLFPRKYAKEFFGEPPSFQNMLGNLPEWLRKINSESADKHMLEDESGVNCIGVDFFFHKLAQSGCSTLSKRWIANHYRWIVWKLACYDRCYPVKISRKLLTASNVMEELKYRYEREINNGHRSALKRILEGDAPPSSPLILCIASIQFKCKAEPDTKALPASNAIENSTVTSIELTDGWYSVKGLLDELLLKQLAGGKLFVGQKLRICGAVLCGWNAPVSPLEASTMINLCLHINGTYRAHWADRLGFCKSGCPPLAFKCIKGSGGVVPITLVGVTRIYPTLYRERLTGGGFVIRSERMESKMMQVYDHRRSSIVEGVMSEFQRGGKSFQIDEQNSCDEGEKISQLLEKAAEPEVIMAEMSSEQLTSFATYQAKIEATRQSEMQKSIEMALMEAGVSRREVNTFMRVRVVGLTSRSYIQKSSPQQGLITIWNPTEKQQSVLVEGQAYAVSGLIPINSDSDTIYLRTSGSTTKWQPLSMSTIEEFQPFFHPRKPVSLSKMGEVPLSSEFDVAAFVIYVGEVHKSAHQKKQWVFVADGSVSLTHPQELSDALLAISFCSPSVDCDSIIPINYNLVGSTVGFCNLIKCAKDQMNHIWVAEAGENSTYFLSYDGANSKHLKDAATSADRWAKASSLMVEKLKAKVSSIVAKK